MSSVVQRFVTRLAMETREEVKDGCVCAGRIQVPALRRRHI